MTKVQEFFYCTGAEAQILCQEEKIVTCDTSVMMPVLSYARNQETDYIHFTKYKQEEISMNNMNNIIKALVESVIGGLLLALLLTLMKDITFVQALTAPATIVAVVSAFIGSCIGFQRKARKQGQA